LKKIKIYLVKNKVSSWNAVIYTIDALTTEAKEHKRRKRIETILPLSKQRKGENRYAGGDRDLSA